MIQIFAPCFPPLGKTREASAEKAQDGVEESLKSFSASNLNFCFSGNNEMGTGMGF